MSQNKDIQFHRLLRDPSGHEEIVECIAKFEGVDLVSIKLCDLEDVVYSRLTHSYGGRSRDEKITMIRSEEELLDHPEYGDLLAESACEEYALHSNSSPGAILKAAISDAHQPAA